MARKPTPVPAVIEPTINEAKVAELTAARQAMTVVDFEGQENLIALAQKLGYQGALTVGGIEDEIRFYQQRSVESLLETGKRLLLLKEASPHGEFERRVELLGFSRRTAQRFMQTAQKTGKSATVALLANRVSNQKAFLELITHDDDVIENLAELDGFDRMSASQLREKAREFEGENVAIQKLLDKKNADFDKLSRRIAKATPDDELLELQKEATSFYADAKVAIAGQLRQACIAIKNHGDGTTDNSRFMAGLLGQLQADLTALRTEFDLPDVSNARDQELLAEQAQWAGKD